MLRSLTCKVQRNPLPPAISFWKSLFFVPRGSLASLARVRSAIFRNRSRSVRPGNAPRAWAPSPAPSLLHVASRGSLASLARAGSLRSPPRGDVAWSPRPVGQFCPHSLSAHATSPNASGYNHPGTLTPHIPFQTAGGPGTSCAQFGSLALPPDAFGYNRLYPTFPPRLPHVSPTALFRPGRASALPRLRTAPQYGKTSVFGHSVVPLSII